MADESAGVEKARPKGCGICSGTLRCRSPRTSPGAGSGSSSERVPTAHCRSRLRFIRKARGGTDITLEGEYDLPMGLFTGVAEKLLGGSIERDGRHSMENLKALCEATIPAHV